MLLDSATSDGLTVNADVVVLGAIVINTMLCIDYALGFPNNRDHVANVHLGVDDMCFVVC